MTELLFIPVMAILSAWSGGSLWPSQHLPPKLTGLPEICFAATIAASYAFVNPWFILPVFAWCYGWQQSSPAPALHWGDLNHYNPDKKSTLKPFVDWINTLRVFKWNIGPNYHPSDVRYCRLYISIKGGLITLPVGGLGLLGYPAAYELGNRAKNHTVSELMAGASAGLSIYLFWVILT